MVYRGEIKEYHSVVILPPVSTMPDFMIQYVLINTLYINYRLIMQQLLTAVEHLHSYQVVHRDLKVCKCGH